MDTDGTKTGKQNGPPRFCPECDFSGHTRDCYCPDCGASFFPSADLGSGLRPRREA